MFQGKEECIWLKKLHLDVTWLNVYLHFLGRVDGGFELRLSWQEK